MICLQKVRQLDTVQMALQTAKGGAEVAAKTSTNAVLTESQILRIQNAATRINKPINFVGSRASGTAKLTSDWDYVIQEVTNKEWKMIKNSLPSAPSRVDGLPRIIDVFKGPLDPTKPYITIYPW